MNALLALGVAQAAAGPVGVTPDTGEPVTFWVFATLAVLGALGTVASRKAVYCALFVAMTMIILAVFYVAQDALFLGVVQVVVYTGAVMMLFLFMDWERREPDSGSAVHFWAGTGPHPKMNSGSRIRFTAFPIHSARIAIAASPAPRKIALNRNSIITDGMQNSMIRVNPTP